MHVRKQRETQVLAGSVGASRECAPRVSVGRKATLVGVVDWRKGWFVVRVDEFELGIVVTEMCSIVFDCDRIS